MAENILTPEARASFAHVHIAQKAMEAGKPDKYSVTFLFKKGEDLTALKTAAQAALVEKFGNKLNDEAFKKRLRSPFRDQGEKSYDGYEAGAIFVTATSTNKPGVVDANLQDIIDPSEFYSGCYFRATVRAFAYEKAGNVGVSFGLQNVQKLRDGESLSGRMKAQDEFQPVAGTPAAPGKSIFD